MRPLLSLQRVATRAFNTTARQMKNRVPEKQKLFQEDNGLPVHIKGGSIDMLLYRNHDPHHFWHRIILLLASGGLDAQKQSRVRK